MFRSLRFFCLSLPVFLLFGGISSASSPPPAALLSNWSVAWNASPSDGVQIPLSLLARTVRQVIAPHSAGNRLRLRLTNRYGLLPVTFTAAYVGRQDGDAAAIVAGSNRALTFGGATRITIAPGTDVLSDPLDFSVSPSQRLLISLDVGFSTLTTTEHLTAREHIYYAVLGSAASESGRGFFAANVPLLTNWLALESLEVENSPVPATLVTFGDSITDGFETMLGVPLVEDLSSVGSERRYPDQLQRRLQTESGAPALTVVNAGISGNRVLLGGFLPQFGPSALSRLDRDVLALPNVTTVIVMEGTNDFGFPPVPTAEALQGGLAAIVNRLHQAGIRVLIGTLTPARGTVAGVLGRPSTRLGLLHGTAAAAALRLAVNTWIKAGSSGADAVIDFEACVQDPANPTYLLPAYDSGDHLHPNGLGYKAMADCVDLTQL